MASYQEIYFAYPELLVLIISGWKAEVLSDKSISVILKFGILPGSLEDEWWIVVKIKGFVSTGWRKRRVLNGQKAPSFGKRLLIFRRVSACRKKSNKVENISAPVLTKQGHLWFGWAGCPIIIRVQDTMDGILENTDWGLICFLLHSHSGVKLPLNGRKVLQSNLMLDKFTLNATKCGSNS